MFQPTHFALIVVCSVLVQTTNLAGLLMISMVLQSGSVLNLITIEAKATGTNAYGVTIFHSMALVVVVVAVWRLCRGFRPAWPRHLNWPLGLLLIYVLVALVGAWWLPRFFVGIPVNDLIKMFGVRELSPLAWNIGHAVQMLNLLILLAVLVAVWLLCQSQQSRQRLLFGIALGCALVLGIGGYEQLAPYFEWPSVVIFWANNPSYLQAPLAPVGFLMNRVGLPFSEPSYASAYMAAMLLGTLAMTMMGRRWWLWAPATVFCAAGLVNTLGSTGLVAAGVATGLLVMWVIIAALKPSTVWSRRWRAALLCLILLVATLWGLKSYDGSSLQPHLDPMLKGLIIDKALGNDSTSPRAATNWRALELLKETYGLGVGMGSQRSSSYFASLLANTGVIGFCLFIGVLITLLWRYWKATVLSDAQIFVAAALPTATLAMGLGIPDLNMPMYWGFIILGFVFCPGNEADDKGAGDGDPPARA
jgi:hypothetical protein